VQLERVQALGIPITHLDAHQHLQLWPLVREVVLELATANGIGALRAPRFRSATPVGVGVSVLGRFLTRAADHRGIVYTTDSIGIAIAGHLDLSTLERVLTDLSARQPSSVEVTVHPGCADDPQRARYSWGYHGNKNSPHSHRPTPSRWPPAADTASAPMPTSPRQRPQQ